MHGKKKKQNKTRHIKSKVLKLAEQGNLIGGRVPRRDKRVRDTLFSLLEVPQIHQPKAHNTYTEYLVQIHVGFMLASSVFVSPYESCIVNSVENLSCPILQGYPISEVRTQWRPPISILSIHSVSDCGSDAVSPICFQRVALHWFFYSFLLVIFGSP